MKTRILLALAALMAVSGSVALANHTPNPGDIPPHGCGRCAF